MATTMKQVFSQLPADQRKAADKMFKAGISPFAILEFLRTYVPEIIGIVDQLIELWNSLPKAKAKADTCDEKVAEHLCVVECALIEALYAHHQLCHELGCCPDHDPA